MSSLLKKLIQECINEMVNEKLVLKRHGDKMVVVSDLPTRAEQAKETFKSKEKLKSSGFRWDSEINSWTANKENLHQGQQVLAKINKVEEFVEKFEDLAEFVQNADNLSRKDELSQKIDGFIKNLGEELDETAANAEIKAYLDFQAKLRSRSAYNSMLIWIQKRNATHVEGYRTWQEKFGRQVKKGAKAITIFAPRMPKKAEPDAARAAEDDDEVDDQIKKQNVHYFIPVTVFDITDTDPIPGKEHLMVKKPEWHSDNTPNEVGDKLYAYATKVAEELGINITRDVARGGEQGYASGDHINISSDVEGVNKAATMIHEIAHELLHFDKKSIFYVDMKLSRAEQELQAEAVSYVVLRHYDMPVRHQTTYMALWKANKEGLQKHLNAIKKVADFVIKKIDEVAAEKSEAPKTDDAPKVTDAPKA